MRSILSFVVRTKENSQGPDVVSLLRVKTAIGGELRNGGTSLCDLVPLWQQSVWFLYYGRGRRGQGEDHCVAIHEEAEMVSAGKETQAGSEELGNRRTPSRE